MIINYEEMDKKIKSLISTGKIKDENDFDDMGINDIKANYGLCVKDLLCYRCYKDNKHACKYNCGSDLSPEEKEIKHFFDVDYYKLPSEGRKEVDDRMKELEIKYLK